jgi:hypothetical protein
MEAEAEDLISDTETHTVRSRSQTYSSATKENESWLASTHTEIVSIRPVSSGLV